MSFFQNKEASELAQDHIEAISKLEDKEAEKLIKRYKEIRVELRDRLDTLPETTFTAQQLRSTLVQVESAIEAMKSGLLQDMGGSSKKAAFLGSDHLIREINKFNNIFTGASSLINVNAAVVANETSNFLYNRYDSSLEEYSAGVRANISRELSQAVIEKVNVSTIIKRMNRYLMGEEWVLRRIARTELHNVYNTAKQNTLFKAAEQEPELMKTLIHPMDSRTGQDSKQADKQNLIVAVDKPFKYSFTRKLRSGEVRREERVFMTPPDRPNDRSIMVPYMKDWDQ